MFLALKVSCPALGWVSPAIAEGIWGPGEDLFPLLWSDHYQQWNWWDHQAPGGGHWSGVHHQPVGSSFLGLLICSPNLYHFHLLVSIQPNSHHSLLKITRRKKHSTQVNAKPHSTLHEIKNHCECNHRIQPKFSTVLFCWTTTLTDNPVILQYINRLQKSGNHMSVPARRETFFVFLLLSDNIVSGPPKLCATSSSHPHYDPPISL